jgi:hypothetical protein
MNAYDAYRKYVAIKLHFQQKDYDYFKFAGVAKVSREKFETRNDKYFFQRIAKVYNEEQFEQLLVANFISNKSGWIGDIFSDDGRKRLLEWKKTQQALEYLFEQDLQAIKQLIDDGEISSFNEMFSCVDNDWPELVTMVFQSAIKIETFIIMNKVLNFFPKMDSQIADTLVWPELRLMCTKYSPFIKVDVKRYKKIMRKIFVEKSLVVSV